MDPTKIAAVALAKVLADAAKTHDHKDMVRATKAWKQEHWQYGDPNPCVTMIMGGGCGGAEDWSTMACVKAAGSERSFFAFCPACAAQIRADGQALLPFSFRDAVTGNVPREQSATARPRATTQIAARTVALPSAEVMATGWRDFPLTERIAGMSLEVAEAAIAGMEATRGVMAPPAWDRVMCQLLARKFTLEEKGLPAQRASEDAARVAARAAQDEEIRARRAAEDAARAEARAIEDANLIAARAQADAERVQKQDELWAKHAPVRVATPPAPGAAPVVAPAPPQEWTRVVVQVGREWEGLTVTEVDDPDALDEALREEGRQEVQLRTVREKFDDLRTQWGDLGQEKRGHWKMADDRAAALHISFDRWNVDPDLKKDSAFMVAYNAARTLGSRQKGLWEEMKKMAKDHPGDLYMPLMDRRGGGRDEEEIAVTGLPCSQGCGGRATKEYHGQRVCLRCHNRLTRDKREADRAERSERDRRLRTSMKTAAGGSGKKNKGEGGKKGKRKSA